MSKEEYANLHYLLAKLKYELLIESYECDSASDYVKELREQVEAIDLIMKVFIIENPC